MSAFFVSSEYNYSYHDTSHHQSTTHPTFYGMEQRNDCHVYSRNQSELDYNTYDRAQYSSMIPEVAPSIPGGSHIPGVTTIHHHSTQPDMPIQRPPVSSWPMEYLMARNGAEVTYNDFGPISSAATPTPDLMHAASSAGSTDETSNVFEMHFGAAIGSSSSFPDADYRYLHFDTSGSARSSSPPPDAHEPIRYSRHSPKRTPSPPSDPGSTSDHRRRFPCLMAGCLRRFTSQYTLKVHMEAHKPKPKVAFPCTHGCNERFSRQHDRLRHEVAKHGKVCEFSCDECGRFFSTAKTLGNHKCPASQGGTRWVYS
ncbi:hypothetical protein GYMLUDRAFT_80381 [Collybiopsis luxurians FD-317 M1]|nr:hypothetical protein GYMLUDRAFT_80381 [Collybiopsis luxurians FD-317 M1]